MYPAWCVMADVLAGEDAIKNAGDKYLPRFAEDDDDSWLVYKERATFFEITDRAATAMNGFLFRKDPQIKVPSENEDGTTGNPVLQAFMDDATLTGRSFYDVAKDLSEKVLGKARAGAWIDWSDIEGQPFAMLYAAEDIINWRYERINDRMTLTMLMLYEQATTYYAITGEDAPDDYEMVFYDQWRELKLESDGNGGYFMSVTLWRRRKPKQQKRGVASRYGLKGTGPAPGIGATSDDEFVRVNYTVPERRAKTLQEIPFVFFTTKGPDGRCVPKPPLYGMAKQNIKHYRTDADLSNVLHVLGCPTPFAAGFTEDEQDTLYLGSSKAWTTSEPNAKAGFVALQGSDVAPLVSQMEAIEKRMAELGARMLDASSATKTPEAFQTVALRQTGETSVLMNISLGQTQSLQDVLSWALWWTMPPTTKREDVEKQVGYTLNTDFLGGVIDPTLITALLQSYLQKGISFETLFSKLQSGEIIPPDVTVEEEKKRIMDGEELLMGPMETQLQLQMAAAKGAAGKSPPAGDKKPPAKAGTKPPPKKKPIPT